MKIAVIGAGIAGITSAYYLSRQGYEVDVYEQESSPAMRTSFANGGQVSVSNSETWTSWSNVVRGARWMFKKDAPLLIRPSLDWDKAKWLAEFLWHTARNVKDKNTAATIKMGIESRHLYEHIIKRENIQFDQSSSGILHFYKTQSYFDQAQRAQGLYQRNGCEWKILTRDQVIEKEPGLKTAQGIVGGTWTEDDWTGDIHKFCRELTKVLKQRYSVRFFFDYQVDSLELLTQSYDKVVLANGIGSVALSKTLGDRIPIYPVKGYSITIDLQDSDQCPAVSLLDDEAKIVTSRLGNRFRVAGTAELAGENYDIRRDRIEPLLSWVKSNFPTIDRSQYSQWACLRPMTPDMMPIVKQSKNPKVFYHVGHGHLGWTLSPATANQLVYLMSGR